MGTHTLGRVPTLRAPSRTVITSLVALAIGAVTLTGCSGGDVNCALDGCRVAFDRSGGTTVSVLGVQAHLVGVENGEATIDIAGNTVVVPVGGEQQAQGFTVGVESVTDTQVIVRISGGSGG